MPTPLYPKGPAYLYTLADPRSPDQIRYLGKAVSPLRRLEKHCRESRKHPRNHRECWLKGIQDQGVMPLMRIVEECPPDLWVERERCWIAHLREKGFDLLNGTDGGDGLENPTPEIRDKIGKGVGKAQTGRPKSPEHRAKLAIACERARAAARNPDIRAKMSASGKRRWARGKAGGGANLRLDL